MLSAIAGVSLTFMAMGFAVQIFAAPATAVVSMLLMLLFYAGQVGASECFRVLRSASECFRVLPSASECFRVLPRASEGVRVA